MKRMAALLLAATMLLLPACGQKTDQEGAALGDQVDPFISGGDDAKMQELVAAAIQRAMPASSSPTARRTTPTIC